MATFLSKKHIKSILLWPSMVLLLSLSSTYGVWKYAEQEASDKLQDHFDFRVMETIKLIEYRIETYIQVMRGVRGLFKSSKNVTREEFHLYISSLSLDKYYPGIQGVGYSLIVPNEQKDQHIANLRNQGFPKYMIHPKGNRDLFSSIIYLEPFSDRNLRAFGYDMFSEPTRKIAMERSRDFNEVAISGKVKLVQETEEEVQAGFLMYLPFYKKSMPHGTLTERRTNIIGWIYSVFRMNDLMDGIEGERTGDLAIEIYDGNIVSDQTQMLFSDSENEALFSFTQAILIGDHTWTVVIHSLPLLKSKFNKNKPESIVIIGLIFSLLLTLFTRSVFITKKIAVKLNDSEKRFRLVFEQLSVGVAIIDKSTGDFIQTNQSYCDIVQLTQAQLASTSFIKITHQDDIQIELENIDKIKTGEIRHFSIEKRLIRANKSIVWVNVTVSPIWNSGQQSSQYITTIEDITERKKSIENLKLAASVFTHAREGIFITDVKGNIIDINDTFISLSGYSREEVIGQNPRILKSGQQSPEFYAEMWQALLKEDYWSGEIWNRCKNGEVYPVMQTISAVHDQHGITTHYVSLCSDISLIKEHQEQLEHIAHYDILTHLPNRSLLSDRLSQAMLQCSRHKQSLAVVFLDLDGFKAVNDVYGHDMGDELLIALSVRMKEALREGDSLARIGGDEFVAVLTGLNTVEDCEPVLERFLLASSEPVTVDDVVLNVSASIGVTIYPQDNMDADLLMRHADQAMYVAKQLGKNRYHLFDIAQDEAIKVHRESLEAIRNALDNHQFVLYYQPKVNMRTGIIMGVEALIRWQHPERGLLNPIEFLPIIEHNTIMIEMGEWVIDRALTQISQWQSMGINLLVSISVNIAAVQLQHPDFTQRLTTLLAAHPDVEPHYLELEVLETSALENVHHVSIIMNDCIALGVKFALDDFGTGYSSLTYLRRLPVSLIKIDQTFVRDMLNDTDDLAIVEGVIALAKSFKRDVIAEGVETIEHGTALLELGCDLAQGYGIARPMPASDIHAWFNNWKPIASWQN